MRGVDSTLRKKEDPKSQHILGTPKVNEMRGVDSTLRKNGRDPKSQHILEELSIRQI